MEIDRVKNLQLMMIEREEPNAQQEQQQEVINVAHIFKRFIFDSTFLHSLAHLFTRYDGVRARFEAHECLRQPRQQRGNDFITFIQ